MIDIVLMYNLLKSVPSQMRVILIGDKDQLPSIGPGNVFNDIIESNMVKVVKLQKIYRQAVDSDIIKNAHRINKGYNIELNNKSTSDFFFIPSKGDKETASIIIDLFSKRLPQKYNLNPITDIQLLCPMQRGEFGTRNMCIALQSTLNKNTLHLKYSGMEFRLNDKVMQIKNNYNKEVFNGDIGVVNKINLENSVLTVDFYDKEVEYTITELEELVLAYAVTIHKSQGSEYPVVIMPISMSNYIMLQRNLIYTGITRAKKLLILIGDNKAVSYAIQNNKATKRNTYLQERLKSM